MCVCVCVCVCVSSSVISKPQQTKGLGPLGLSSHENKSRYIVSNIWMTVHVRKNMSGITLGAITGTTWEFESKDRW